MLLTRTQFDERLASSSLNIAFIGMSNIGKSYLSHKLETQNGFDRIDVDKKIQDQLGLASMNAIAKWLGHPYEDQYKKNSELYLKHESSISTQSTSAARNTVLDTTGSVIHLAKPVQKTIRKRFLVIYLKASSNDISTLKERYFRHPKPTIWPEIFTDSLRSSNLDDGTAALIQAYPDLLKHRASLYEQLADVSIEAGAFTEEVCENSGALSIIRNSLPA